MNNMEIPPKLRVGRKPDPTKSTLELREYWRRKYYERKAVEKKVQDAQDITPSEEESETN